MADSKNQQNEALKIYHDYWESYSKGNLEAFSFTLDENFEMIGTSESEVCHTKAEGLEFYKAQMAEVVGKVEMRNRNISAKPLDGIVLINETCDIYVLGEPEWTFYSKIRISTLLHETASGWKVIQQHGSLPDMRVQEGETLALEKITKENLELRDAVKRRTAELENKNRELAIETALERVRAVAMGMKKPEDMLDVCRVISGQLEQFGVEKIRNVQTAIIDETLSQYLCYQYFPAYDQTTIEDTQYQKSPVEQGMVNQMLDSRDGYFIGKLYGEELEDFRSHRKEENHFPDPLLDEAKELDFCFLSIGEGGLGLTVYQSMTEEVLNLFRRFHQVFSLAYQRFRDIQKAEEQAREAQIEAALERVRSTSLAMHNSQDLSKVVYVVFTELVKLDAKLDRCLILTVNPQTLGITWYLTGKEGLLSNNGFLVEDNPHPSHLAYLEGWRTKRKKWHYFLAGEEKKSWDAYGFSQTELAQLPDFIKADMAAVESIHLSISSDDFGCLIASSLSPLSEVHEGIVDRFTTVFNQTYTRFLDLQKAEAQAREAQIQLALERVRARTMAMQKSDELPEAANLLFQQVQSLGMPAWSAGYCTWVDDERTSVTLWMSSEGVLQPPFTAPTTKDELFIEMRKGQEDGKSFHVVEMGGDKLVRHYQYMRTLPVVGNILDSIIEAGHPLPTFQIMHQAYFSKGFLLFITYEPVPESHDIFIRFAQVFEQTYTRFLDLQKAEAQAREAQIEAALERVRSRSMAMHKSEELREVIQLVFEQFRLLNFNIDSAQFDPDYKASDDMNLWTAVPGQPYSTYQHIPYFDNPIFYSIKEAKEKNLSFLVQNFSFEEKNEFFRHFFKYITYVPKERQKLIFESPGCCRAVVFLENIALAIQNYSNIPYTNEEIAVLKRFGKTFEQVYTRFLDLQKAEAQAREAQIETVLERVRSRTLGMQKSGELREVIQVIFEQFQNLGIDLYRAAFAMDYMESEDWFIWSADIANLSPTQLHIPYFDHPYWNSWNNARRKGLDSLTYTMELEEKNKFVSEFAKYIPDLSAEVIQSVLSTPGYTVSNVFLKNVTLYIDRFNTEPFSDADNAILMRFGKVFEQTYTRFKDLEKAEAQAREAQIQLALERVRARTMAMQSSEELAEVSYLLNKQVVDLGIPTRGCAFNIYGDYDSTEWFSNLEGTIPTYKTLRENIFLKYYEAGQRGETLWIEEFEGDRIKEHYKYLATLTVSGKEDETIQADVAQVPEYQIDHVAFFKYGYLLFITLVPAPEAHEVFRRFAKEFEQTYTRFLDLQKAEVQAKDARIEAALERVRSRTMGMQKAEELGEVATVLFGEINTLVDNLWTCGFVLCEKTRKEDEWWLSLTNGLIEPFSLPNVGDYAHEMLYEGWEKGEAYRTVTLENEQLQEHYDWLMRIPIAQQIFEDMEGSGIPRPNWQRLHAAYFKTGYLVIITEVPCEEEEIFKRFAQVFDLTYTRFLDLQKAEVQAREAQIANALEKVRSRSLAMQKPDELVEVAELLRGEMGRLGVEELETSSIYLIDPENRQAECWYAIKDIRDGNKKLVSDEMPLLLTDTWVGREMWKFYQSKKEQTSIVMMGENRKDWINYCADRSQVLQGYYGNEIPERTYHLVKFNGGYMGAASPGEISPASWDLLKRAASVFSFAFTRFKDLQDAAARTREAQIELALEKVRGRTMAMQSSEELADAAYVLFEQLNFLGVTHERINIGIVNEDNHTIDFWVTEQGGDKLSTKFSGRISEPTTLSKAYEAWKKGEKSLVVDLIGEDLKSWLHYLKEEIKIPFNKSYLHSRRVQTAGFFSKGMLIVTSPEPLQEEAIYLLEKFAGVFDLTYTRFNDLKIAEAHALQAEKDLIEIKIARQKAEDALSELKSTQAQLIQAEKMASLGELTAGIAHEIQNPLNFVNNFSEVSAELVDEMNEELEKGDLEEVKYIASELKENLSKINHHGKRAGSIVKGMLEHSRKSEGKKELTDLNQLADECLRLSFHGLRAKDKTFQADFKTDLDPNLPKLEVVSQDIGRVLLNLINNAFYAVGERAKKRETDYKPSISISSTTLVGGTGVKISISDNGPGIPDSIKDKIFQPFFTTKPTGQGTGLGLSLSYDIVKAHGGELKVETKEGVGCEFIVQLPNSL